MANRKQSRFGTTTITVALLVALMSAVVFGGWLGMALTRGERSKTWAPVTAEVIAAPFPRRHKIRWLRIAVEYSFDGNQYRERVHRFGPSEKGDSITVYVNPDHPTQITSERGLLAIDYGLPLVGTLLSLGGVVVLACIIYSPKDDYESEVNDTLF